MMQVHHALYALAGLQVRSRDIGCVPLTRCVVFRIYWYEPRRRAGLVGC